MLKFDFEKYEGYLATLTQEEVSEELREFTQAVAIRNLAKGGIRERADKLYVVRGDGCEPFAYVRGELSADELATIKAAGLHVYEITLSALIDHFLEPQTDDPQYDLRGPQPGEQEDSERDISVDDLKQIRANLTRELKRIKAGFGDAAGGHAATLERLVKDYSARIAAAEQTAAG